MDFSRLNYAAGRVGGVASVLLIVAILFLPWYRRLPRFRATPAASFDEDALALRRGEYSCTGFETFPILRWLLLLAALAPLILALHPRPRPQALLPAGRDDDGRRLCRRGADRLQRDHRQARARARAEIGISLDYGYWVALLSAIVIAIVGFTRSIESGPRKTRKAPGTV